MVFNGAHRAPGNFFAVEILIGRAKPWCTSFLRGSWSGMGWLTAPLWFPCWTPSRRSSRALVAVMFFIGMSQPLAMSRCA